MEQNPMDKLSEELKSLEATGSLELKPKPVGNGLRGDQQKALEALNTWLYRVYRNRDEQNFFALRGSAGTGKTTLLATFLAELKFPYKKHRVCICAPTHKAKKVLQQKTKWQNAETIQALLGMKMDTSIENFDPNRPEFAQNDMQKKMRDYELVVIDEGSMVNSNLFQVIVETAIECGTKVLFVGDPLQLNPVKEYNISPALITPVNQYELTEIIRQEADNPIVEVLAALRRDIIDGTSHYIGMLRDKPHNINAKGQGYKVCTRDEFAAQMIASLSTDKFKEDKNFCRFISWTNDSITGTNKWIRREAMKAKDDTLDVGELLLGYRTIAEGDDTIVVNSDDYEVQSIKESIVSQYEVPIETFRTKIVGIDTNSVSTVEIVRRNPNNYENYVKLCKFELEKAQKRGGKAGWGRFYEFKNHLLCLDNIFEDKTLVVKKDLDYGYGITIHKSQGSTYDTVFVNGKDINRNQTESERKRLWYVAMSRTSNLVYINL